MALEQEETKVAPRLSPRLVSFGRVLVFVVATVVAIFAVRMMLQGGDRDVSIGLLTTSAEYTSNSAW